MTDAPAPKYEPLPSTREGAIEALQARIDAWHNRFTDDHVGALQAMLNHRVAVDPAYLEQRDKIAALGLDPDILAPLPAEVKQVGSYVGAFTYPEAGVRDWLEATGFSDADIEDIVAELNLVPPGVLEWFDSVDDGEFTDDDGRKVVVRTGGQVNPLTPRGGTPATGRKRPRG